LFGHWEFPHYERLYLALREEGDKGTKGKSSWKELKFKDETFEMLHPGIPKKVVKGFLVKKWNL
jgi:hypothetical protein